MVCLTRLEETAVGLLSPQAVMKVTSCPAVHQWLCACQTAPGHHQDQPVHVRIALKQCLINIRCFVLKMLQISNSIDLTAKHYLTCSLIHAHVHPYTDTEMHKPVLASIIKTLCEHVIYDIYTLINRHASTCRHTQTLKLGSSMTQW